MQVNNLCAIMYFAGSFGYADDVALVASTLYAMNTISKVCEIFAPPPREPSTNPLSLVVRLCWCS